MRHPAITDRLFQARLLCATALGIGSSFSLAAAAEAAADTVPAKTSATIPWSQISAKAGADYQGDGLGVMPTADGARLRCVFQRLEGEATREGLWLTSTVIPPSGTVDDRFRIVAVAVGREVGDVERGASEDVERESVERGVLVRRSDAPPSHAPSSHALADESTVALDG